MWKAMNERQAKKYELYYAVYREPLTILSREMHTLES